MGRARGSNHAAVAPAPTTRGRTHTQSAGIGLGALNPSPASASAPLVALLLAETQRGEFDAALSALARNVERVGEAPLINELLEALCETAAAEVRANAEALLRERLAERGVDANFSYEERKLLRAEIATLLSERLLMNLRDGEPVSPTYLRHLAAEVATEVVAENVIVYSE
jgi:hypothetical protein